MRAAPARVRTTAVRRSLAGGALILLLAACGGAPPSAVGVAGPLRDQAPDGLMIGSAVAGGGHHRQTATPDPLNDDPDYREVLASEFSSLTPENQMKWEFIHPARDEYDFAPADAIVEFAAQNGQVVRGHALLWHSQNPAWLEQGDFSAEELREILREHIQTVVGRYAGRIQQWDVANEVLDDDGQWRRAENIWIRELGEGIVSDAFRWAHEADPAAMLFLNDYAVEGIGPKSDAYLALAEDLLADDVPVHGFGVQGHLGMQWEFPGSMQANLQRFADLGLATAVTELDVRMSIGTGGPTAAQLDEQAEYYRGALEACLAVEGCDSFTIWGFTDRYSWVPYFFAGEGAATIMDHDLSPKPAHAALVAALVDGVAD